MRRLPVVVMLLALSACDATTGQQRGSPVTSTAAVPAVMAVPALASTFVPPPGFRDLPLTAEAGRIIGPHVTFMGRGPRVGCFLLGTGNFSADAAMIGGMHPGFGRCNARWQTREVVAIERLMENDTFYIFVIRGAPYWVRKVDFVEMPPQIN